MTKKKASAKLDELIQLKKEFQEKAKAIFNEEFAETCKLVPGLEAVRWDQYAPYFNDGEACEFSVNEPYFSFEEETSEEVDEDEDDYEGNFKDIWSLKYRKLIDDKQEEALNRVAEIINCNEMEEALKDMFGDNSQITYNVKSGKFEVTDSEHD